MKKGAASFILGVVCGSLLILDLRLMRAAALEHEDLDIPPSAGAGMLL
jgi:hypothetical protein